MPGVNYSDPSDGFDDAQRKAVREHGKLFRRGFTDVLQAAGLQHVEYAIVTDVMYLELFGCSAKAMKPRFGLSKKSRHLRDRLPAFWLSVVMMAEIKIAERIVAESARGLAACIRIVKAVAAVIRDTFMRLAA